MSKTKVSNSVKLRSFRKVNALSRRELAELVGKTQSAIYKYENDIVSIPESVVSFLNKKFDLGLSNTTKTKKTNKSTKSSRSSKSSIWVNVKSFKNGKTYIGKSRDLGRKIQEFRKANNMTAYKLGSLVGKAEKTVWNYENGSTSIPVDVVETLNNYGFGAKFNSSTTTNKTTSTKTSKKTSSFSDRFKSIRSNSGLTLKQFASKYAMAPSHVYNLESGKANYLSVQSIRSFIKDGIDFNNLIGV